MSLSRQERGFWKKLGRAATVAGDASVTDLFAGAEAAERRHYHLAYVIQRKARALGGIVQVPDLVRLPDRQLDGIRRAFSERIGFLKSGGIA